MSRGYSMSMALRVPRYFALGVWVVWLVDTRNQSIEVSQQPNHFETIRHTMSSSVPSADLTVLIDLAEVFAGLS